MYTPDELSPTIGIDERVCFITDDRKIGKYTRDVCTRGRVPEKSISISIIVKADTDL